MTVFSHVPPIAEAPNCLRSASSAYMFVMHNAPYAVFDAYTACMDSLVTYIWGQLLFLKNINVALLFIETLVVIPLLALWQWYLISRAERVRMVQWMLMAGLPMPVLRALTMQPPKISDDSEDDSGAEAEEEEEAVGKPEALPPNVQQPLENGEDVKMQHNDDDSSDDGKTVVKHKGGVKMISKSPYAPLQFVVSRLDLKGE